ncbi:MAG: uracil-DNA glycosylase family protein, partial [Clostridia bacterium]
AGRGWEQFTDEVIKYLNARDKGIVFMLWGANAISKKKLITNTAHLVLTAPHPSPLSAYQGFYGCKHFTKANEFLANTGREISW